MAAVGSEVTCSWFLSSGVVSFFILLLLLSIFLTALCSDCRRRSFELRDPEVDRNPSSLIRVVKLEEAMGARENPMINEIQNDEKGNAASFTPWRSHLGAPHNQQVVQTNGSTAVTKTMSGSETSGDENPVSFTPWRSHLGAPQSQDLSSSAPQDHIYSVIRGGRGSSGDADASSPPTNQEPGEERGARSEATLDLNDRNSMYARVSRKERQATPPVHTPEEVQVEEEEEEESSPPLPDRRTQLEG
ncbi:uncharacterized protein [Pagrus major]|uniref:uncharacterized protein n=1 Tax=Pagrus major TaxID=143350 RepID=UPI003CC83F59